MNERTIGITSVFHGRLLDVEVLDVEMASGTCTTREIVRHKGAVAILARLDDGRFVLVRQYRKPVESVVLEIVAGLLEEGEAPDACAVREVKEETGYDVKSMTKLGEIWPSPGYTSELLHLFYAELSGDGEPVSLDDDEMLEPAVMEERTIEKMIRDGKIRDGKTLAAWCMCKASGQKVTT